MSDDGTSMRESHSEQNGLIHAFVLDGSGGARQIGYQALPTLQLQAHESLWLHWDRSQPGRSNGCAGRADSVRLPAMCCWKRTRGPHAGLASGGAAAFPARRQSEPRCGTGRHGVRAGVRRSATRHFLRLRPLRSTEVVIQLLSEGRGPKTASELLIYLAEGDDRPRR